MIVRKPLMNLHRPHRSLTSILLASVFATGAFAAEPVTLSVTGQGRISATPDVVYLNVTVQSHGPNVLDAKTANDQQISAIREYLQEFGLPPEQFKNTALWIRPIDASKNEGMQWSMKGQAVGRKGEVDARQVIETEYSVGRTFRIELRQLDRFEAIYAGLVERGVSAFDGVTFDLLDMEEIEQQANVKATESAIRIGKQIAEAAGFDLCEVHSLSASGNSRTNPFSDPFSPSLVVSTTSDDGMAAGQIEVQASVTAVLHLGKSLDGQAD